MSSKRFEAKKKENERVSRSKRRELRNEYIDRQILLAERAVVLSEPDESDWCVCPVCRQKVTDVLVREVRSGYKFTRINWVKNIRVPCCRDCKQQIESGGFDLIGYYGDGLITRIPGEKINLITAEVAKPAAEDLLMSTPLTEDASFRRRLEKVAVAVEESSPETQLRKLLGR